MYVHRLLVLCPLNFFLTCFSEQVQTYVESAANVTEQAALNFTANECVAIAGKIHISETICSEITPLIKCEYTEVLDDRFFPSPSSFFPFYLSFSLFPKALSSDIQWLWSRWAKIHNLVDCAAALDSFEGTIVEFFEPDTVCTAIKLCDEVHLEEELELESRYR